MSSSEPIFPARRGKTSFSAIRLKKRVGKRGGLRKGTPRTSGIRLAQYSLLVGAAAKDTIHVFALRQREQRARLRLTLDVLTDVATVMAEIDVSKDAAERYFSEGVAAELARGVAVGIHVRSQLAFAKGLDASGGPSRTTRRKLYTREGALRLHLATLRRAAVAGDGAATLTVLQALSAEAHEQLPELLEEAARASRSDAHKKMGLGLGASILARRYAMAAAACIVLHRRLLLERLARTTKPAAEKTTLIRRDVVRPELARTQLTEIDVGRRFSLIARTTAIEWIERPRKPYTRVEFDGASIDLHVPHRSLERRGAIPGVVLWATGTVKTATPPYLESEFEGPGTHRARYFEDYLATLARPSYDLYPGTMLVEWEFPRLDDGRGANDLIGRLL